MIWNELGIGGGTALIVLCALYFVVKWAVRSAIVEATSGSPEERRAARGRYGTSSSQRTLRPSRGEARPC